MLYARILIIVACLYGCIWLANWFIQQGENKCVMVQQEAVIKEVVKYEKNYAKTNALNDPDLLREYCKYGVYRDYNECVQTVSILP